MLGAEKTGVENHLVNNCLSSLTTKPTELRVNVRNGANFRASGFGTKHQFSHAPQSGHRQIASALPRMPAWPRS